MYHHTVILAAEAVLTYFITIPMFHPSPHCKSSVTAISLESLWEIWLPLWLPGFTAADFCWLVRLFADACLHFWVLQFNQDKCVQPTVWCASPTSLLHWCLPQPLSPICFFFNRAASKSRAGGRIYQQHFVQEDPGPPEGEGDLGGQLWERGGISHQWTVKETHASEWWEHSREMPIFNSLVGVVYFRHMKNNLTSVWTITFCDDLSYW